MNFTQRCLNFFFAGFSNCLGSFFLFFILNICRSIAQIKRVVLATETSAIEHRHDSSQQGHIAPKELELFSNGNLIVNNSKL